MKHPNRLKKPVNCIQTSIQNSKKRLIFGVMHTDPMGLEGPTTYDNIHLEMLPLCQLLHKAFQAFQEPSTIKP